MNPQIVAPKGPWQEPHPDLTECTRHKHLCAYRSGDPTRCDDCHASWSVIDGWPDTKDRETHTAEHRQDDAIREKSNAKRALSR